MTGREFSTGIETSETDIQKLPDVITSSHCPHCKLGHRWWTHEARIVNAIRPSDWIENKP